MGGRRAGGRAEMEEVGVVEEAGRGSPGTAQTIRPKRAARWKLP